MSNLVTHAERELRKAGLFDADSDYGGMLADAVIELIAAFSKQGHSGMSAAMTRDLFARLSSFKTLTPLTSAPDEWMQVSPDIMADGSPPVWQSLRQHSCFSNDGGKTYYDIDAGDDRAIKTAEEPK